MFIKAHEKRLYIGWYINIGIEEGEERLRSIINVGRCPSGERRPDTEDSQAETPDREEEGEGQKAGGRRAKAEGLALNRYYIYTTDGGPLWSGLLLLIERAERRGDRRCWT